MIEHNCGYLCRHIVRLLFALQYVIAAASSTAVTCRAQAAPGASPEPIPIQYCTVNVNYTPEKPASTFRADQAFGAGIDGLDRGSLDRVYTGANVKAMLSAGFKPLAYRLRTELGVQAWHWNPEGTWSDAAHKQGYWTCSSHVGAPNLTSYGYRLPRRGDTIDQAGNNGYSRILDGDNGSFWKSNPYLDSHFTHDDNTLHAQWIVLDLGLKHDVSGIRILWADPYAAWYRVDYCTDDNPNHTFDSTKGRWKQFQYGAIASGKGGNETIHLSDKPVETRFVRIMLLRSSGTAPKGSKDIRDRLGFAVREVYLGIYNAHNHGEIQDWLKHGRTALTQSTVYVSSTDPWHRASDIDLSAEQPGFDRVLASGLTNGLPVLMPVSALYDTPDNAAQLIKYLKSGPYPVGRVEIGEEPDGQNVSPEDYGALYIQCADAIHRVAPDVVTGGPGLQTSVEGYDTWPDAAGNGKWLTRFVGYLTSHHKRSDLGFFSFEWYPFDDVKTTPRIETAARLLRNMVRRFETTGVPRNIPWLISEYGYSSMAGSAEVDLAGAIIDVETAAQFLQLGGSASYFYGYEPNELINESPDRALASQAWGNLLLFLADSNGAIMQPVAAYYAAGLVTQKWTGSGSIPVDLYSADTNLHNGHGDEMVSVYPVRRAGKAGEWSLLVLNKDLVHTVSVHLKFTRGKRTKEFTGPCVAHQYSAQQYVWHANGQSGFASPDDPPVAVSLPNASRLILPPYSITVVQCAVSNY